MKRLLHSFLLITLFTLNGFASITLGGKTYETDTLYRRQVGPSMVTTNVRNPDYPHNI